MGFPIRRPPAQSLLSGSPELIAANHVLHRLLAPRHPPHALSSLTINQILIISAFKTYIVVKEHSNRFMVEVNGVEPMASCVQGRRSPTELHPHQKNQFIVA